MPETNEASGEMTPALTAPPAISGIPQFSTAEYAHLPQTETCALCSQRFGESYYRAGQQKLCAACAERVLAAFPRDNQTRFVRGQLLGIGAALVGLAAYAAFTIVAHIYFGYIALGVGWLIGKAILKGSGNVGGRRYQIAAVALTYLSIALAEVPILIANILHNPKVHLGPQFNWARAAGPLLWYGITSPFQALRQPAQGVIGLIILFIGLRIAWTMTQMRGVAMDGPYPVA